jgi:ribosomal protein S18 acetylase RimI-like enzyme
MMAVLAHTRNEYFGLRPMDPMKDLAGVADLIEEAFADDLDRSGQSALRELRWLSRIKPILWWMVTFSADHSDFLSGFVWEEEGRLVGNVTVNRTSPGSRRWLISNLAVAKDYRGRGIARGLMDAALGLVEEYRGTSISLQVRADNAPAKHLYDSLHFNEISGTAFLRLRRVPLVMVSPLPPEVTLRCFKPNSEDSRLAYNLACAATPLSTQKEWPLRQSRFRLGSGEQIKGFTRRLVGSGHSANWVVQDGRRFVATVNAYPGVFGQHHRIELIVHPDWRGVLEKPLLSRALSHLFRWRKKMIVVKHPVDHREAIETYKELGFREDQVLLWMKWTA